MQRHLKAEIMSLVVARIHGERIAIASDTLLTEHERPLPYQHGVIKSCMLSGDVCASFVNSPELAARDFRSFTEKFPQGAGFAECVSFFEESSATTGNEYILAFGQTPRLVKIKDENELKGWQELNGSAINAPMKDFVNMKQSTAGE